MLRYMRILAYTTILLILAPMIVYAAIENGIELSDSEGVKIGEYEESTIILDTIFDEGFESVIFEIEPSSESEIITVMLYNGMFDYPADLDEYYVLADAEPANVKHIFLHQTVCFTEIAALVYLPLFHTGRLPSSFLNHIQFQSPLQVLALLCYLALHLVL